MKTRFAIACLAGICALCAIAEIVVPNPNVMRTEANSSVVREVALELEVLRNGIDRTWNKVDNGVWVAPTRGAPETFGTRSEPVEYEWEEPVRLSGARIVFDSLFKTRNKRMRKLEATQERRPMPQMLAKGFRVEVRVGVKFGTHLPFRHDL